jgi:hypothetical protein
MNGRKSISCRMTLIMVILGVLLIAGGCAVGGGTIKGHVTSSEDGDPVKDVTVVIQDEEKVVASADTEKDGSYVITHVEPGTYDVAVEWSTDGGGAGTIVGKVTVKEGKTVKKDIRF